VAEPLEGRPGTLAAEICLWLAGMMALFFMPVLIAIPLGYSVWRLSGSTPEKCRHCASELLVPLASAEAIELLGGGAVGEVRRQAELDEMLEVEKDRRAGMAAFWVLLGVLVAAVHYFGAPN